MTKEKHTTEEIKKAFWDTFHKIGEVNFNYLDADPDICESSTNDHWEDFLENLQAEKPE